jgi:SAM-dependent MidA family methyltransferase
MPPEARLHHQRLLQRIQQQAEAAGGALSFDVFMELALYAPGLGYYVAGRPKLGASGDFITAPELSPLFARCLAAQCAEVLERLGGGDLLEFGAGRGILAAELLSELERLEQLPQRYLILEPSPDLQAIQRERLQQHRPELSRRVRWLSAWPQRFQGVALANEVLDAMPVHAFCVDDAGAPQEVFITPSAEPPGLSEWVGAPRSPGLAPAVRALQAQGLALTPGYRSEINLRLPGWMQALGQALERGLALLIDYGYPRTEYYHPQRTTGTLMAHSQHQAHNAIFDRLGLQDLSAQVDFSAVAEAGVAAGFTLAGYSTQAHFLIGCGLDQQLAGLLEATADPHQQLQLSAGARQLVLPAAMGERFQVIALARNLPGDWRGFGVRDLRERL